MKSSNQRAADTTREQEFQHSLQLLDVITSWQLWGSGLMILLLPATITLLSLQGSNASLLVRGLLGMTWMASLFTLYHQKRRLQMLRKGLIEQTDAATKSRVKGEQFYGLSILDPLTELYNRRFGETRLEEEITRAKESDDPLLLLAIDFDRFKQINDNYGHNAGDMALKEFSRRLQRAIRACDLPIRVGGDEFLVILPECPPDKIQMILSRMDSISFTLDGKQIPVSFSHGMAQYQLNDTPEALIKRADERLYAAKANRKPDIAVDQTSTKKSVTRTKDSESPAKEPAGSQKIGRTGSEGVRRSGRIPKKIAVSLIGSDLGGKAFSERTHTVDITEHGARVISRHKLAPGQEMIIHRQDTNQEAEVRVVRGVGSQSNSRTYGLAFVSSSTTNIWAVEFPPLTECEIAASRSLFACSRCKGRETIDNSDAESNGDGVNKGVVKSCKNCGAATTWTRVLADEAGTSAMAKPQEFAPEAAVS